MIDVTHCHNERPIYETKTQELFEWDYAKQTFGKEHKTNYPIYHPVIFDIETSAELNQRPILCVAYDTLAKDLIILYAHKYQGYTLSQEKVRELAEPFDQKEIILHNLSQSNFEKHIIRRINEWNEKAKQRKDRNIKSLVAHNTAFDIPMMGSPNDGLLDSPKIGEQYEMSVQYKHVNMIGHRAGQFGQIYQFLDSNDNFKPLYIPVGDTMVSAQALWIPAGLKDACEHLDIEFDVSEATEHGQLTDEYVSYCMNDVWATYQLYQKLSNRLQSMFGNLPIEHIYSTASIGKYVLKSMGYKRVGYEQTAVDRIAPAYFGGRTDAEITGEIVTELDYTDILSQYPTVSKLTNVWQFMQCETVSIKQINPSELPAIEDLRNPDMWPKIANYYVKINPQGATLPIRTPHLDDTTKVVTANVHSADDLQYHYMDSIAAELIDGERQFEIVAAWKVIPNGNQELSHAEIAGVDIEPADNVMAKSIEARKDIQLDNKQKGIGGKDGKNSRTQSLKIVANSLYGCSAERIVKEIDGEKHDIASHAGFYNPHVATTITAGGRLMIALGEHLATEYDSELIYCDTDSLILPTNVSDQIIEDFTDLNPYEGHAGNLPVLEKEKENGNLYAVGTKKYIFFADDGTPLEVKEHGLGNYQNLRDETTIERLWATILYYDTDKNPLDRDILFDGKLNEPILWSFNASTRSMRKLINDMTQEYVRYGDWIESTISYDNSVRFMALNLTDKDPEDLIAKVEMDGETPVRAEPIAYEDMNQNNQLKTVRDIVFKFTADAATPDERPRVNVTDTKVVTKEATNRKDIFTANLEKQFYENAIHLETVLP